MSANKASKGIVIAGVAALAALVIAVALLRSNKPGAPLAVDEARPKPAQPALPSQAEPAPKASPAKAVFANAVAPERAELAPPACVSCENEHTDCAPLVGGCDKVEGTAQDGPARGTSRRALCEETWQCVRRTNCGVGDPIDCYCGEGADIVKCIEGTEVRGACRKEIERGLESSDSRKVLEIYMHEELGAGMALARLTCSHANCKETCFK